MMLPPSSTTVPQENETLVATFHRVRSLISADQDLLSIPPEMRVAEALKLMKVKHYSQLPVVAGDAVLGVFSYRSFSFKAATKNSKEKLGELPVEDFLEDFEYVHAAEDWNRVLRYLNQDDAFFVGHRDRLDGLVTTMDVLDYFAEIANPFIMLAEIELSLRQIIQTCMDEATFTAAVKKSLKGAYIERAIPTDLNDMTFDNYIHMIGGGDNWPYFEIMFGSDERTRKQTNQKLIQLRQWRNDIFHFKRRLEMWELDMLAEHREWLQRRVRAFQGRNRTKNQQSPVPPGKKERVTPPIQEQRIISERKEQEAAAGESKRGKTDRDRVLSASDPLAAEFFTWMWDEAQKRGLTVSWGTKGFSIRRQLPHGLVSFAYGYPPQIFEFYFSQLGLSEVEEIIWRRDLLAFGVLQEAGEKTLRGIIQADTIKQMEELYTHLLDKIDALTRYPLPLRATVKGREVTAEMLNAKGRVRLDGVEYDSPSGAAKAASGWMAANGWTFWQFYDTVSGKWQTIKALRE